MIATTVIARVQVISNNKKISTTIFPRGLKFKTTTKFYSLENSILSKQFELIIVKVNKIKTQ